jgi:hypothetical protein
MQSDITDGGIQLYNMLIQAIAGSNASMYQVTRLAFSGSAQLTRKVTRSLHLRSCSRFSWFKSTSVSHHKVPELRTKHINSNIGGLRPTRSNYRQPCLAKYFHGSVNESDNCHAWGVLV